MRQYKMAAWLVSSLLVASAHFGLAAAADQRAGGAHTEVIPDEKDGLTPQERMNRRFPQPVRVGDLIGIPLQDFDDRSLGTVSKVVRDSRGEIGIVVQHCDFLVFQCRPVRVPIEAVVILARHLNLLDITRDGFLSLPRWNPDGDAQIASDEIIKIGIGRR